MSFLRKAYSHLFFVSGVYSDSVTHIYVRGEFMKCSLYRYVSLLMSQGLPSVFLLFLFLLCHICACKFMLVYFML